MTSNDPIEITPIVSISPEREDALQDCDLYKSYQIEMNEPGTLITLVADGELIGSLISSRISQTTMYRDIVNLTEQNAEMKSQILQLEHNNMAANRHTADKISECSYLQQELDEEKQYCKRLSATHDVLVARYDKLKHLVHKLLKERNLQAKKGKKAAAPTMPLKKDNI